MRAPVLAFAILVTGCNVGEPRGDDPIIGAWCVVEGGPAPVYFHRSRQLDDNERGHFPTSWRRDGDLRLWFGDAGVSESDDNDRLVLRWNGEERTLRRTEYVVVVDGGDAGPCDDPAH